MAVEAPNIDVADDGGVEKAFEEPNALPVNKPPPAEVFAFSETFGLQMEKPPKIELTSDAPVVVGGVTVAAVEAT